MKIVLSFIDNFYNLWLLKNLC